MALECSVVCVRCLRFFSQHVRGPARTAGIQLLLSRGLVTRRVVVSSNCRSSAYNTKAKANNIIDAEVEAVEHLLAQEGPLLVTSSSVDVAQVLHRCKEEAGVEEQKLKEKTLTVWQLPSCYMKLSKSRLSALVVATTLAGYAMAPGAVSYPTLLWALSGTALCSASANTFNQHTVFTELAPACNILVLFVLCQWLEVPYDALMSRTKNRPLVRQFISPVHALLFGLSSGALGVALLTSQVNPLTGLLGGINILLYTLVYTPMKRWSVANTWVGSVVGAIPPIMGWTACTGDIHSGALVMAAMLFAWQFPHFNSLSWSVRGDYKRGGYKMMAHTNPALCKRVALRYSVAMVPICMAAPLCDLTTWWFALDTLPINIYLTYLSWQFYREANFKTARKLFRFTLLHLPLIMAFLLINKKSWVTHSQSQSSH